jgi:uncharacterized protein YndB with AHSA1/START domain
LRTVEYRFSTIWRIDAPVQEVWAAIQDSARWPEWWNNVERVDQLEEGSDQGVGAVQRYTWKGWLPYRLVFDMRVTRVDPLVALEGEASGDVEGAGRWSFSSDGRNLTVVRYDWCVHTNRASLHRGSIGKPAATAAPVRSSMRGSYARTSHSGPR